MSAQTIRPIVKIAQLRRRRRLPQPLVAQSRMAPTCRFAFALERLGIRDGFWRGREDRVRGHGMEAAGGLDVGRADCFVVRAEIEGTIAEPARQADCMPTVAAYIPSDAVLTAGLMDTVAIGRHFSDRAAAYPFTARVAACC